MWYNKYTRGEPITPLTNGEREKSMAVISFINEKGNVAAKVRERLKGQAMTAITKAMSSCNLPIVENADKGISVMLGTDRTNGKPIYAHISVVISQHDPAEKSAKSKTKPKTKTAVKDEPLPDLFAPVVVEDTDEDTDED
jgi:hypothetical protein